MVTVKLRNGQIVEVDEAKAKRLIRKFGAVRYYETATRARETGMVKAREQR